MNAKTANPFCRCGNPVPRNHDEWRYDTCSNACLRGEILIEKKRSLKLKEALKAPTQLTLFRLPKIACKAKMKKCKRTKKAA